MRAELRFLTLLIVMGSPVLHRTACAQLETRLQQFETVRGLTAEAVLDSLEAGAFTPFGNGAYGHSAATYWIVADVCGEPESCILEVANPHLDSIDVYRVLPEGPPERIAIGGELQTDRVGFSLNRRPVLVTALNGGGACDRFLLHIRNRQGSITLPIKVYEEEVFWDREQWLNAAYGIVFGMFLLVIFGAFLMARLLGIPMLRHYAFYAITMGFFAFSYSGFLLIPISWIHPVAPTLFKLTASYLIVPTFATFSRHFFSTATQAPRWDKGLKWLTYAYLANIAIGLNLWAIGIPATDLTLYAGYVLNSVSIVLLIKLPIDMRHRMPRSTRIYGRVIGLNTFISSLFILQEVGLLNMLEFSLSPFVVTWAMEMGILLHGVIVTISEQVREKQALAAQLHQAESERNQAYVEGLEEEKRRVAAELHDDVLSRLALMLNKVGIREGIRGDLQDLSKQVRGLSKTLHPITFGGQSLPERLQSLVLMYRDTAMTVQLYCIDVPKPLDERVEFELFRIAQEALQNAHKHADADKVFINLTGDDTGQTLTLTVEDDGRGFDVSAKKRTSLGLRNLEHRAGILQGTLNIESAPGRGTLVEVSCPTSPPAPDAALDDRFRPEIR
ncbi:MAG: sensor histidine kinase [Flavobacteriales bacterium]